MFTSPIFDTETCKAAHNKILEWLRSAREDVSGSRGALDTIHPDAFDSPLTQEGQIYLGLNEVEKKLHQVIRQVQALDNG